MIFDKLKIFNLFKVNELQNFRRKDKKVIK
jgi:hypothetical protein